jgi:putative nucleotidyltransferase with HDIG domain
MFESLRRARLQREGLSCGKVRRKHQDDDLVDELRTHPAATLLVYAFFFGGLGLLMKAAAAAVPGTVQPQLTSYLAAAAIGAAMLIHLAVALRQEVEDNAELALVLGTLLVQFTASVAMLDFAYSKGWTSALPVLAMPHALGPMILSVALGRKIGLFAAIYASLLGAIVFIPVNLITYLACSALIGFLVVLFTNRVRRRNKLFMAGIYTGLVAAAFSLILHHAGGTLDTQNLGRALGVPLTMGILTGLVVGGTLPMIESLFGVTTEMSWLEQADLNHPLMKRLSIEAPGTYHHSLIVASIAEAAAEAIGANAVMTRVCAYFHDIGKLTKPEYFIENMDPALNPHEDLTARMSALILIAHVKDGVDLAIKHKLNCHIIDVIEQHHGTTLAWYFYKRALDQKAEMIRLVEQGKSKEDDIPQVTEDVFRYPGPKPQFKESAIISLADAIESASRSLEKPTPSRVETLVDEIVQSRMADGQLDECDLTIAELARVKASFVKTLLSMMHSRVKYQKATEAAQTSIIGPRDPAAPANTDTRPTSTPESSYLLSGETPPSERKKRTPRKTPPASAA